MAGPAIRRSHFCQVPQLSPLWKLWRGIRHTRRGPRRTHLRQPPPRFKAIPMSALVKALSIKPISTAISHATLWRGALLRFKPANVRVVVASERGSGTTILFSFERILIYGSTACLSNIGGHPASALHSDIPCATKGHRRAAKSHSKPSTQTGSDWPVNT